jgi:SagB-type dehydrogenase family enzyme
MNITGAQYHLETSYDRHKMGGHFLDWENQPSVFKTYPGVTPIELPRKPPLPKTTLCSLLKEAQAHSGMPPSLSIGDLSRIFLLSYSLTAKARHAGGDFYYRSVASAGALYPSEIYVASCDVEGLENGLYHFSLAHHGLSLLRKGDMTPLIRDATRAPSTRALVLTFFLSVIFFRSAWKYRERSYRYHLLDTGHLIENLTLALKALRLPFSLSYDFDDRRINFLLGLDDIKEACLAIVQIPWTSTGQANAPPKVAEISENMKCASQVSPKEIDYPIIQQMHREGFDSVSPSKPDIDMLLELGVSPLTWLKIESPSPWPETMDYAETIFHRRSRRNFVRKNLSRDCFSAILDALCSSDKENASGTPNYDNSVCTGFITGNVEGFEPGFYLLDNASASFGMIRHGFFIERMARVCLDQMWLCNAGVHFVFVANLQVLDRLWGARGYRYAMMTAGQLGERLYLAAESMGLGCCGIGALYDYEAAEALGHNDQSSLLYLVALGAVKARSL